MNIGPILKSYGFIVTWNLKTINMQICTLNKVLFPNLKCIFDMNKSVAA